MSLENRVLCTAPAIFAAMSCAQAHVGGDGPGAMADASCGASCDQDTDGVPDGTDRCPDSPMGERVNRIGCADSQLTATLAPMFPPFGLTWTPTGDPGRAGGLSWTYTGIQRADLFHIYWVFCDDPATACGLSLDGSIDAPSETWQFDGVESNLPMGKLAFTNSTQIVLADSTTVPLSGRLAVTIVESGSTAIPFADLATLDVGGRAGRFGVEIPGTGFRVVVLAEVRDGPMAMWTPFLDYFDAAPTPERDGGGVETSFSGSFYSR